MATTDMKAKWPVQISKAHRAAGSITMIREVRRGERGRWDEGECGGVTTWESVIERHACEDCALQFLRTHNSALLHDISMAESTIRHTLNKLAVRMIQVIDGWEAFKRRVALNFTRTAMKNITKQKLIAANMKRVALIGTDITGVIVKGLSSGLVFPEVPYTISWQPPVTEDCKVGSLPHNWNPVSVVQVPILFKE